CILYSIFYYSYLIFFFFSSRRRHTRFSRDWSSDVCSSDLEAEIVSLDTMEIGSMTALRHYVEGGLGVALIPRVMSEEGLGGTVRSEERRVGKECRTVAEMYELNKRHKIKQAINYKQTKIY